MCLIWVPVLCKDFVGYEMSIPDLLREEASKAGLVASECWMAKVEQLYTVAQYRHGKWLNT